MVPSLVLLAAFWQVLFLYLFRPQPFPVKLGNTFSKWQMEQKRQLNMAMCVVVALNNALVLLLWIGGCFYKCCHIKSLQISFKQHVSAFVTQRESLCANTYCMLYSVVAMRKLAMHIQVFATCACVCSKRVASMYACRPGGSKLVNGHSKKCTVYAFADINWPRCQVWWRNTWITCSA